MNVAFSGHYPFLAFLISNDSDFNVLPHVLFSLAQLVESDLTVNVSVNFSN